jgi:hypothetical protein
MVESSSRKEYQERIKSLRSGDKEKILRSWKRLEIFLSYASETKPIPEEERKIEENI